MIKNIIFDLCGPIITLDLELMNRRFRDYGVTAVEKPYQKMREEGLTKIYEQGLISTGDFCSEVRRILQCDLTDEEIFDCWNTVVADFPPQHAETLAKLSTRYRLFLLSNSDVVNAEYFIDYIDQRAGEGFMKNTFSGVFFSCDLRLRKPDPKIFLSLAQKTEIDLAETLFVDDCQKHTQSAASLGINVIWLKPEWDIADLFDERLDVLPRFLEK
ncbi:MAG: HAD-IA family hydrolase [Bacteroidales bacterium]|nr:HAD-IA family hydrolase [Bacteroidales bacterium]